jgi:phenylpropionate dioxygenase-like ring-hydroxylating dioxygenase large terminal subunit
MIHSIQEYIRTPLLYNHWYCAGTVDEFTRAPMARTLLERSIVFFRTEAGELRAFQNRCLHRSYPLSEGMLDGDHLICSYHGVCYDADGAVERIPSQANAPVPKRHLKRYPLEERGQFVFIWMGDGAADYSRFPDLPQLGNAEYRVIDGFYELAGSYLFMLENLYDLTHFVYLHRNTFNFDDSYYDIPPVTTVDASGLVVSTNSEENSQSVLMSLPASTQEELAGKSIVRRDDTIAVAPGIVIAHWYVLEDGQDHPTKDNVQGYINHYMTPVTTDRCLYWYSYSINRDVHNDQHFEGMSMFIRQGFQEDVVAVQQMQTLLDEDTTDVGEMSIAGDKAGILFRRVILKWAKDEYGDSVPNDEVEVPVALVREPVGA